MKTKYHYFLLLLWLIFLAPGCSVLKMVEHGTLALSPPDLEYRYYEIRDVGLEKVGVDLIFAATNHNEFDIDKFYVDYQFYIMDKKVAEGYALEVNLIPKGLSKLTVPVDLRYEGLFDSVGSLADLVIKGEKEAPSRVHVNIYGNIVTANLFGKEFNKIYNYQHDVDMGLPLPEITMETIQDTAKVAVNSFLGFKLFEDKGKKKKTAKDSQGEQAAVVVSSLGQELDMSALEAQYPLDWGINN